LKQLLVGGGFVDFATLHPLLTGLILVTAVLVVRRTGRAFAASRRLRLRRPPRGGDGEGPRPASGLV
jgi:hypothetical protein